MNRWPRPAIGCIVLGGLIAVVTGCGAQPRTTARPVSIATVAAAGGRVSIGALTITGGYIPQPAAPDVAAAYFTITNTGATPDTITRITTSVTSAVMAMTETDRGGIGTMTDLGAVTIPPHGRVEFTPGRAHLMLEHPTARLRAGQVVYAAITFAHAGTVTLKLPVRPLSAN